MFYLEIKNINFSFEQGNPGYPGPEGPQGVPGCNGSKVCSVQIIK